MLTLPTVKVMFAFAAAVTPLVWMVATVRVWPLVNATVAGTEATAGFELTAVAVRPWGAAELMKSMTVRDPPPVVVSEERSSWLRLGGSRVRVTTLLTPPRAKVTSTVVVVVTPLVWMRADAEPWPVAIVIAVGTVARAEFELVAVAVSGAEGGRLRNRLMVTAWPPIRVWE